MDLNCDMGENIGNDGDIMPYITSANIASEYHAGDETSMRMTIRLAKQYGVSVGAHPSWRDRQGFGRREMSLPPNEVEALVLDQIRGLHAVAKAEGAELHHVKPHGALYNQAARDMVLASAIARAVKRFSGDLILVGLAGSSLVEAGVEAGLRVANEGFPDRNYDPHGRLVSRKQANAIIVSPDEVAEHAVELAMHGVVFGGRHIRLDTLCLHGDHPHAAQNAIQIRETLEKCKIMIATL